MKLLEIIKKHVSNNNKIKMQKVIKYMQKLEKKYKDNDYVSTRDSIVFGVLIISEAQNYIEHAETTKKGRKDLEEIMNEIKESFKEENIEFTHKEETKNERLNTTYRRIVNHL